MAFNMSAHGISGPSSERSVFYSRPSAKPGHIDVSPPVPPTTILGPPPGSSAAIASEISGIMSGIGGSGGGGGGAGGSSDGGGLGRRRPPRGRTQQQQRPKRTQRGPIALTIRADGSAIAKWPTGGTAVSLERSGADASESRQFTLSAFFGSGGGGLAVMVDGRGGGSANYASGRTALSLSATHSAAARGFAVDEQGSETRRWGGDSDGMGGVPAAVTMRLGDGLGLEVTFSRTAGGLETAAHVFFDCRGVKAVFSQAFGCAILPDGTSLFGDPQLPSFDPAGGGRRQRGKRGVGPSSGVRALAIDAAAMPPLSHADRIMGIREAIAGL